MNSLSRIRLCHLARGFLSGFVGLQGVVCCNLCEVFAVVQQRTMMFECRGGTDAVVALADFNALLSQLAVNGSCPNEYSFRHWQHDQGTKESAGRAGRWCHMLLRTVSDFMASVRLLRIHTNSTCMCVDRLASIRGQIRVRKGLAVKKQAARLLPR